MVEHIAAYVLSALLFWVGKADWARHETPETLENWLTPWALAIARQCDSDRDPYSCAARMAAHANLESRFAPWVVDGSCNYYKSLVCDSGKSIGPWQIQPRDELTRAELLKMDPDTHARFVYRYLIVEKRGAMWTVHSKAEEQAREWLRSHPGQLE